MRTGSSIFFFLHSSFRNSVSILGNVFRDFSIKKITAITLIRKETMSNEIYPQIPNLLRNLTPKGSRGSKNAHNEPKIVGKIIKKPIIFANQECR